MNGIIHVVCKILKNFMASFAEAELVFLFFNAQYAAPISTTLIEMNHSQPQTLIQVENFTAAIIATDATKQRMPKSTDMWLYWIWCRMKQDQFSIYWKPGKDNLVDYPTNHHPPNHHIMVLPSFFHDPKGSTLTLQGCVNSSISAHTACMLSLSFVHKTRITSVLLLS